MHSELHNRRLLWTVNLFIERENPVLQVHGFKRNDAESEGKEKRDYNDANCWPSRKDCLVGEVRYQRR